MIISYGPEIELEYSVRYGGFQNPFFLFWLFVVLVLLVDELEVEFAWTVICIFSNPSAAWGLFFCSIRKVFSSYSLMMLLRSFISISLPSLSCLTLTSSPIANQS